MNFSEFEDIWNKLTIKYQIDFDAREIDLQNPNHNLALRAFTQLDEIKLELKPLIWKRICLDNETYNDTESVITNTNNITDSTNTNNISDINNYNNHFDHKINLNDYTNHFGRTSHNTNDSTSSTIVTGSARMLEFAIRSRDHRGLLNADPSTMIEIYNTVFTVEKLRECVEYNLTTNETGKPVLNVEWKNGFPLLFSGTSMC